MNVNAGCSGDGGGDLRLNPTLPPSLPHRDLGQGVHPGQGPCYKVMMAVVMMDGDDGDGDGDFSSNSC